MPRDAESAASCGACLRRPKSLTFKCPSALSSRLCGEAFAAPHVHLRGDERGSCRVGHEAIEDHVVVAALFPRGVTSEDTQPRGTAAVDLHDDWGVVRFSAALIHGVDVRLTGPLA